MKYNSKFFKDNLPEWKKQKDPFFVKYIFRPLSFPFSAFCANHKISANTVSYISSIIAIIGCICFLCRNNIFYVIGGILFNIWLLMDCIDGNLARSVKKQPFGDFADAISSYILVGLMNICIAYSVYVSGGIFFKSGDGFIILLGALASESDTLMRLIYQKYKNNERELISEGYLEKTDDIRTDKNKVNSLRVRIELEFGMAGFLTILILLGAIFKFLDLIVIYALIYYGLSCVISIIMYVSKAIIATRNIEKI